MTDIYTVKSRVKVGHRTAIETTLIELCPLCVSELKQYGDSVEQAGHFTEDEYTGKCDHCYTGEGFQIVGT